MMEAHVGGLGQPLHSDLIQVLQRSERPAVEQVLRNIRKRPFNLTFGLRPVRAASPGLKAIVGSEGQKTGVVNRLVAIIAGHYDFHVVVQTSSGQTTEVRKSADMFADGGGEVLRLYEPYILAARVSQDITEGVNTPPALGGEIDLVGRVVHLGLQPWGCFKALDRGFGQMRPECAQPLGHNRIAALETQAAQFLV